MKKIIVLFFLAIFTFADDLQDAIKAYDNGNINEAFRLYTKVCNNVPFTEQSEKACISLGEMYEDGQLEKNPQKEFEVYKKACDFDGKKSSYPCNRVILMYAYGKGINQDYLKAFEMSKKYCEKGDMESCYIQATMYYNGQGVSQDYSKAFEIYKKVYDTGSFQGIFSAGHYLGRLYYFGQGVTQDYFKAQEVFRKVCDETGEKNSCYNLGFMYLKGEGLKQDNKKAKELFGKSCEKGYQKGCDMHSSLNSLGY